MACTDYDQYLYALLDHAFRDAFLCPFGDYFGIAFASTLLIMFPVMAIWITTESFGLIAVLAILIGGVILPSVMPVTLAIIVLIIGIIFGMVPVVILNRETTL